MLFGELFCRKTSDKLLTLKKNKLINHFLKKKNIHILAFLEKKHFFVKKTNLKSHPPVAAAGLGPFAPQPPSTSISRIRCRRSLKPLRRPAAKRTATQPLGLVYRGGGWLVGWLVGWLERLVRLGVFFFFFLVGLLQRCVFLKILVSFCQRFFLDLFLLN